VVVVIGLMVKGTRILVVDPLKSWLRVPQKVMPRNPDKLAYAKCESRGASKFTNSDISVVPGYKESPAIIAATMSEHNNRQLRFPIYSHHVPHQDPVWHCTVGSIACGDNSGVHGRPEKMGCSRFGHCSSICEC